MSNISSADLILNQDGSIYHLALQPGQVAKNIITVGDPERVPEVSKYFDHVELRVAKREIVAHTGRIGQTPVTVISTGMGTDNIEIVLTELDALFNMDLNTRTPKEQLTRLNIVRIGTSGALQPDIPVDAFVSSSLGVGVDALGDFYPQRSNDMLLDLSIHLKKHIGLHLQPYAYEASPSLLGVYKSGTIEGTTLTCPGFYAPQGRVTRLPFVRQNLADIYRRFEYKGMRITNFEMETAGIYALCQFYGHNALSLNAIVAQRFEGVFSEDPKKTVEDLIQFTLAQVAYWE
jgi:uridine phosphorylase